jgi:hypothetical protein
LLAKWDELESGVGVQIIKGDKGGFLLSTPTVLSPLMPWLEEDYHTFYPDKGLRHFVLELNQRLACMLDEVVEHYAFAGPMAVFLLATSEPCHAGEDGKMRYYPQFEPSYKQFSKRVERPSTLGPWKTTSEVRCIYKRAINAINVVQIMEFECHLKFTDSHEAACAAFEAGLDAIYPSSDRRDLGYWTHTRKDPNLLGEVMPDTSTYVFERSRIFRVVWSTVEYPPREITNVTYPPTNYIEFHVTIPLIIKPLLDSPGAISSPAGGSAESAEAFVAHLRGILGRNVGKGKRKAK